MAALLNPAFLYVGSDKWTAVAAWTALTLYTAGMMVRQLAAPTLGNERVFVCIVTGTTLASEPAWTVTKGAKTAEAAGPTWQECTGQPSVNGDATHTLAWTASAKSNTVALGQIIKRDNGVSYQICSTAGTAGSGAEPSFSDTAGTTTADNTVTWTSLGVVGNFAAFAAPHQRILNADASTWSTVAGSTFYISNAHAETQASAMTLAGGQGTVLAQNKYVCVSNSVAPPTAVTTGATVSTTGVSGLTINLVGYYAGISFLSGSGSSTASTTISGTASATHALYFENCSFTLNTTDNNTNFLIGPSSSPNSILSRFNNCTFVFGNASQRFQLRNGIVEVVGGSFAATGTLPTVLITPLSGGSSLNCIIRDCDLSAITGTLYQQGGNNSGFVIFENCKINSGVTIVSSTPTGPGSPAIKLHNCDSGTKNYRFFESVYMGTILQDTVTINNAGASDGTQAISWKIVTGSSVSSINQPFQAPEITMWQDTTGSSKTATIEIAGAGTLTNSDIWLELEYPGSSATPIGSVVSSRATDIIATPSNAPTSSASWSGSPAVKQYLQVTFTPQMKGPIKARVFVGKQNTTVYIDPMITVA